MQRWKKGKLQKRPVMMAQSLMTRCKQGRWHPWVQESAYWCKNQMIRARGKKSKCSWITVWFMCLLESDGATWTLLLLINIITANNHIFKDIGHWYPSCVMMICHFHLQLNHYSFPFKDCMLEPSIYFSIVCLQLAVAPLSLMSTVGAILWSPNGGTCPSQATEFVSRGW